MILTSNVCKNILVFIKMWKRLALNYIMRWIILSYNGSKVSGSDSLDCDFETGFCNWLQRQQNNFDWKVGATSTNNTGPNGDHTTGDGFYAYTDTSPEDLENNDRAYLVSPEKTNGTYCFSLWYYLYGEQAVTLRVFQNSDGEGRNVFKINSSQEQRWILETINISSTSSFKIIIRGSISNSDSRVFGVIAIDDILMFSGNCPTECDDPTPTYGSVDDKIFKPGSVVGIACRSGYTLKGRSSITCLANGTWSGKPECHLIEQVDTNALTVMYVTVPLAVVALVITLIAVIWRKRILRYCSIRGSHRHAQTEQPQPKTFTNMAYSEHFNENQSNQTGDISQDDEYAVIADDRHKTGQGNTPAYYNITDAAVTAIKDHEHTYNHTTKSGKLVTENTYSHLAGDKNITESNYDTTEFPFSGNTSSQLNTNPRNNNPRNNNYDVLNTEKIQPRCGIDAQPDMHSEEDSEYDHAQAGGTDPKYIDDYSHLNVEIDKYKPECSEVKYGTLEKYVYTNTKEQTERATKAYEQSGDETPEYFVLEPQPVCRGEDERHYFVLEREDN